MSAGPVNGAPLIRVGIIGYGIMGKAHSYGYRVAPMLRRLPVTPVVTVMSGRDGGAVAAAAAAYGVPATVTDWRDLIALPALLLHRPARGLAGSAGDAGFPRGRGRAGGLRRDGGLRHLRPVG